jgi:hypothetical protein
MIFPLSVDLLVLDGIRSQRLRVEKVAPDHEGSPPGVPALPAERAAFGAASTGSAVA